MKTSALAIFFALTAVLPVWAAPPGPLGATEDETKDAAKSAKAPEQPRHSVAQPWKHKFGIRLGDAGFRSECIAFFYENQIGRHWAVRPSIEFMAATESYYRGFPWSPYPPATPGAPSVKTSIDPAYDSVEVDRGGAAIDCIFYALGRWRRGIGPYLLAGLGLHSIDLKNEYYWNGSQLIDKQHSATKPALSVGLGCHFGRFFGMEYKHYFSTLNSPFPEDIGKNWNQVTLNFRFPVPGQTKGGQS
jgi:hypothetical protein